MEPTAAARVSRRWWIASAVALAMVLAVTAAVGWWRASRSAPLRPVMRLSVEMRPDVKLGENRFRRLPGTLARRDAAGSTCTWRGRQDPPGHATARSESDYTARRYGGCGLPSLFSGWSMDRVPLRSQDQENIDRRRRGRDALRCARQDHRKLGRRWQYYRGPGFWDRAFADFLCPRRACAGDRAKPRKGRREARSARGSAGKPGGSVHHPAHRADL